MENKKCKILLVDDNEIIRIFFRDVFWLHGLDSKFDLEVADGVEAARKIINDPSKKPEIFFLDLVMPIEIEGKKIISPKAGLTLLKEIKESENLKDIRVFVFSAETKKETIDKSLKMGAERFLAKENHLPQDLVKVLDGIYIEEHNNH